MLSANGREEYSEFVVFDVHTGQMDRGNCPAGSQFIVATTMPVGNNRVSNGDTTKWSSAAHFSGLFWLFWGKKRDPEDAKKVENRNSFCNHP
jgi:hypothetical protein